MPHELSELMHYGFRLERTAKKMKQTLQKRFATLNEDITVDQWVMLDCLYQTDRMSQNELADYTFKDAPTVTRIIDLLCKKEFTERQEDSDDRRKYKVCLTTKGKELVERLLPTVGEVRKQGLESLEKADFERFMRTLDTIFRNFD